MTDAAFWRGRRVLVTGHTGFKGAWLSLWLDALDADVIGLALPPPTNPNLFTLAGLRDRIRHIEGDLRDAALVERVMRETAPEIVLHLAAQSLVRPSYEDPLGTWATNVMGTAHLLDAARRLPGLRAMVVVTSDKCYENREWVWGYRESDAMGGHDPYSASKGAAEILTASYRRSFFADASVGIATARAGNVIGGGDWARDRLVPDAMRAFATTSPLRLRNPASTRPWQHVLEPLCGYLTLAQALCERPHEHAEGWNFGPDAAGTASVAHVVDGLAKQWGGDARWEHVGEPTLHEARALSLDCAKAHARLGWRPRLTLEDTLAWTVDWYRSLAEGADAYTLTNAHIERYESLR
jgi:CDP-glucose 4,6-dehydratase